jgi:chitin synthase
MHAHCEQVMSMVVLNALWMTLMLVFLSASASSLNLLGTNPLGLAFLLLFGFLFFLQFLSMLWHRNNALVEYIANVEVPWKAADPRQRHVDINDVENEQDNFDGL